MFEWLQQYGYIVALVFLVIWGAFKLAEVIRNKRSSSKSDNEK